MPYITYHKTAHNQHVIGIQVDEMRPTYYRDAICLNENIYFPTIANYDSIDVHLRQGFFRPADSEQRAALRRHNLDHYRPSKKVANIQTTAMVVSVQSLEAIAEELAEMENYGLCFKP